MQTKNKKIKQKGNLPFFLKKEKPMDGRIAGVAGR